MALKSFGVKELNVTGSSGTPTLTSSSNLNVTATTTTFSGNVTVSGNLTVSGSGGSGGSTNAADVKLYDVVDANATSFYNLIFQRDTSSPGTSGAQKELAVDHGGLSFNPYENVLYAQYHQAGSSNVKGHMFVYDGSSQGSYTPKGRVNNVYISSGDNAGNTTSVCLGDISTAASLAGDCVYVGRQAGEGASGFANIGIGYQTLSGNGLGHNYNTGIGYQCLKNGDWNVGIGYLCGTNMTGSVNVLLGQYAGRLMTAANANVAIGYSALSKLTMGKYEDVEAWTANPNYHIAIGYQAAENYTGGQDTGDNGVLIAIGRQSQRYNEVSAKNISIGDYAALNLNREFHSSSLSTGHHNIAIGREALKGQYDASDPTTVTFRGSNNVAVGRGSLLTLKGFSASSNTGIGNQAGDNISTGSNNTCLGSGSDTSTATASNEVVLGNSSVGVLRCQVQTISSLSDERDKTDIVDLPIGLDFVNKLRPVKFKWAMREESVHNGTTRAGFIAQELSEMQKGNEYINLTHETNPDRLEAQQGNLIPVLVKAIQDLSAKIDKLESQIQN